MSDRPFELTWTPEGMVARVRLRGSSVLSSPMLNRGTAFTQAERKALGLTGLLPDGVSTIEGQLRRVYAQYLRQPDDLAKSLHLGQVRSRNEVLFYRLLTEHIHEMLPIVYTPTVGTVIQRYSLDFGRPRGVYLSVDHPDQVETAFRNYGLGPDDVEAMRHCMRILEAGFPLVAFLQLVRVYAQSLRKIADTEVRLFHLYIHEPLIRDGVHELEMATEMRELTEDLKPMATPLFEYMHNRYLRFFIEQDVVGHMESEFGADAGGLGRISVALCFIDLTGFTRFTEEEGDEEALDLVERFVDTVEATLPPEATIVKTIGDEVMVVSPDPGTLTEWAAGFLSLFQQRPQPRVGLHYGQAVYRDGDYFGTDVNLAHRVVTRALGGEVLVTDSVMEAIREKDHLGFENIGQVKLKGFDEPRNLCRASLAE